MPDIIIVNASDALTDKEAAAVVPAIQRCDSELLVPAWGFPRATYSFMTWAEFFSQQPAPDPEVWPIFLNLHSTDPGALGWHDDQDGRTFGRVFVGDCKRDGISWTVDLSHEAFEMRGNPYLKEMVTLSDGRIALRELCDPVEDDIQAIEIDGVKLSNFVLRSYFDEGPGPWDYQKKLTGSCPVLTDGGYQTLGVGGQWIQMTAMQDGGRGPSPRARRWSNYARRARILAEAA